MPWLATSHANRVYACQYVTGLALPAVLICRRDVIIILTFAFCDQGLEQADALAHEFMPRVMAVQAGQRKCIHRTYDCEVFK